MNGELRDQMRRGLASPICLTWEITYGCNLSCVHCLSSSGKRRPDELTTAESKTLIDRFREMSIFYVNIGGGEPMIRRDFFEIIEYATTNRVGVKFSTNGSRIDKDGARRLAAMDYLDVQISIDGHDRESNDAIRGDGAFEMAIRALSNLKEAGFDTPKISVVATRDSVEHLDGLDAIAKEYGAQLRITRLRPSGRGVDSYSYLNPTSNQQHRLYQWLSGRSDVLTGDSFFHLSPLGEPLDGLNMCGAGRVVCLIDPVGDVYACPFTIDDNFKAGNIRDRDFEEIWQGSPLFQSFRETEGPTSCTNCSAFAACNGGCMATKYFTGLSLDDPDPDCAKGLGANSKDLQSNTALITISRRPQRLELSHQR
ncbi:MAG: mycofactocin radical SAM maturase [Actinomycetota bacterium]|nr:mycofactocin radical SAM maturase [Actinomycetota bacterium]